MEYGVWSMEYGSMEYGVWSMEVWMVLTLQSVANGTPTGEVNGVGEPVGGIIAPHRGSPVARKSAGLDHPMVQWLVRG